MEFHLPYLQVVEFDEADYYFRILESDFYFFVPLPIP